MPGPCQEEGSQPERAIFHETLVLVSYHCNDHKLGGLNNTRSSCRTRGQKSEMGLKSSRQQGACSFGAEGSHLLTAAPAPQPTVS